MANLPKNYVPNNGRVAYGLQQFSKRKIKFCNCKTGEQDTIHTDKENKKHNFHYWLIDKKTGKLFDPTPPQMEPIKDATPLYIPWSAEEQKEQMKYNLSLRLREVMMMGITLQEWIKMLVENNSFEMKRCFQNCYAIHNYYKDKYELVCGSMGWIIGENDEGVIGVNMDYGY